MRIKGWSYVHQDSVQVLEQYKVMGITGDHEQLPYQLVALVEKEEKVAAQVAKEATEMVAVQGGTGVEKVMLEPILILLGRAGQNESDQTARWH